MIKSLIASLALSTLCIPQVQAHTFNEVDLLDHFKSLGGRVYIDLPTAKRTVSTGCSAAGSSTSARPTTTVTTKS